MGDLPEGIEQENFERFVLERLQFANGAWTLQAPVVGRGIIPVGLMTAWVGARTPAHVREIHVTWFPWASKRNRVESLINFVHRMRTQFDLYSAVKMKDVKLFEYVCQHGIGRRMGTWKGYFGRGEDAALFQSKDVI